MPGRRQPSPSAAGVEPWRGFWLLPLCLALSLGCRQAAGGAPPRDGGISDAAGDLFAPLTLDISVTGCPSFDVVQVVCSGAAPLTVSFAPVGSPALTTFLWTFGDGTPSSSERAPSHTYALPGKYDVGVTGQGSTVGSLSQVRHQLISVEPLTTGAACDVDAQCGSGLRCLCHSGSGCGPAFSRGICSTACPTGFCGAGAVCAAFALGPSTRRRRGRHLRRRRGRPDLPRRLLGRRSLPAGVRLPADSRGAAAPAPGFMAASPWGRPAISARPVATRTARSPATAVPPGFAPTSARSGSAPPPATPDTPAPAARRALASRRPRSVCPPAPRRPPAPAIRRSAVPWRRMPMPGSTAV